MKKTLIEACELAGRLRQKTDSKYKARTSKAESEAFEAVECVEVIEMNNKWVSERI